jgi:N-acetyl-anhydromuramyl-L-alanine amidase AmpD
MARQRRTFLKLTGSALASSALLGASGTTSAAPEVEWQPAARGNYAAANRSASDVDWIVMHTIEGSYEAGINTFEDPDSNVSAHYVVGEEPGEITKMVRVDDVAYTAGNYDYNVASINVELEGYSSNGFPDQLYENAAELVSYLCNTYGVPKRHPGSRIAPCDPAGGQGGIIGHVQVPDPYDCSSRGGTGSHTDPGPNFDWDRFVSMVGGANDGGNSPDGDFEDGQRVKTTADLVIHTEAALSAPDEWVAPQGSAGYVRDGPVVADDYVWWKVGFNAGHEGWCVQEYLTGAAIDDGPTGKFEADQRVDTTADLVIHTDAALSAPREWVAPEGSAGYVRGGPESADDYTWWEVEFNAGPQGWCVQEYLEAAPVEDGGGRPDGRDPLPFDVQTDLKEPVAVTAEELDAAIAAERSDSPLIGLGDTWIDVQEQYSINALYQAAHAVHESYWGLSNIAQDKNNLYGWNAKDACPAECADGYDSFEQCVRVVMERINDGYLTPGDWRYNGPNLSGMNVYYATDDRWDVKIAGIYRTLANDL